MSEYRKLSYYYNEDALSKLKDCGDKIVGNYIIDDDNKFVIENLIKWFFGQDFLQNVAGKKKTVPGRLNKGLYIAGPCGTGKSLILKVLKEFAKTHRQKFIINGKEVGSMWNTYHAYELCNKFQNGENLSNLYTIPILQIDDLGAEPESCQYMGNKSNVLKELLEIREDKGVITLITSNIKPYDDQNQSIEDKYGERLASRLNSLNYFSLTGEDKRSK